MTEPIIFDYQEYPINRQGSYDEKGSKKPIIELTSEEYPNRKVHCLVDSGADSSISFRQIGEIFFGLKFSNEDKIPNTISGLHTCPNFKCEEHLHKSPVYLKPVKFKIEDKNVTLNVRWMDRGFNPNEDLLFILGRDFFDYFDILFKQREEQFYLYPQE